MEHHFNVELATAFGIEKAVIINNLYFWIDHNAKNKTHIHDGNVWTYNSSSAFAKLFPYIKERTLARYLIELEDKNILISGNYNTNAFDKTKWYAFSIPFTYELQNWGYEIEDILSCQNMQIDAQKMANRVADSGEPIPYNKHTDSKHKEERDKSLSKKDEIADFVERMYQLYPSRCPKRDTYLGKSIKDKDRIKNLLKRYTMEQIEKVIRYEVDTKYGKCRMYNFSTFLNNFPDPTQIDCGECSICTEDSEDSNKVIISGVEYR